MFEMTQEKYIRSTNCVKLHLHDHEFDTNLGKIVIYKIRARIDKKYQFSCADKILSRVPSIRHEVIPT